VTADSAIVHDLAPTGVLRASINLGNPVLAGGTDDAPSGVTVDLAVEIARRLGVPAELHCFDAARKSFEALHTGVADLGFLAVEPEREADLVFTAPYVVIEGVFVVPADSTVHTTQDVDRHGVRVGVKRGSAYDLHLTRSLATAEVVRGDEGLDAFTDGGLEVGAGIRQPVTAWLGSHPGYRLVEPAFMQIRQAVATARSHQAMSVDFLRETVQELVGSGFVREALRRAGQDPDLVAPLG
jgi:polar amino acid transport system substrate-binding protein